MGVGVIEPEIIEYSQKEANDIISTYDKSNSAAFPSTVPDTDPGLLHSPAGIENKVRPIIEGKSGDIHSVKAIIIHGTAGGGGNNVALATWITGNTKGSCCSAHFVIDRDGVIWQTVRLTKYANHFIPNDKANSLGISNRNTIGIELVQGFTCNGGKYPNCIKVIWDTITDKQVAAGKSLVQKLLTTYNLTTSNVYGHGEVGIHRTPDEGLQLITRAGFR
jgi:hypothetical protein